MLKMFDREKVHEGVGIFTIALGSFENIYQSQSS